MYKLKQKPEDFIVKEVMDYKLGEGPFLYCEIEKTNWNTLDLAKKFSKLLNIPEKNIGFAGSKDKKAVTTQIYSFKNVSKERFSKIKIPDVKIKILGNSKERLTLGMLKENEFMITVRNLDKVFEGRITELKNYFGAQRFGISKKNHIIGKLMLQGDFKGVCKVLNLEVKNNNYIGALRQVSKRELLLYLHAYQSYLWNKIAQSLSSGKLELIGFLTETDIYNQLLEKDNLTKRSFLLRSMPELAIEGSERDILVPVKSFEVLATSDDDIFEGKKKQILRFILPKGSYATILIKKLFSNENFPVLDAK